MVSAQDSGTGPSRRPALVVAEMIWLASLRMVTVSPSRVSTPIVLSVAATAMWSLRMSTTVCGSTSGSSVAPTAAKRSSKAASFGAKMEMVLPSRDGAAPGMISSSPTKARTLPKMAALAAMTSGSSGQRSVAAVTNSVTVRAWETPANAAESVKDWSTCE